MVDAPYVAWILSVLLCLTVILIFSLTTCFVKRSYMKQLSNDRQRQVIANNHFQTSIKRAAFIIQLGFLEVCAGLVVVIEATAMEFDVVRSQPEKRCTEHFQCADKLHYLSYAIIGCLFLSIVRCLAQRFVVGRLSKSDVVSMTRVYLVPSTCFVTVLCVWSWFHLYGDLERNQSDTTICFQATLNIPFNSFLLILLPMFWNLAIDYADFKKEKAGFMIDSKSQENNNLKYDSISVIQTTLFPDVANSENPSNHALLETTGSRSANDKKGAETKLALFTTIPLPVQSPTTSQEPQVDQFTERKAMSSVFDSLCGFLHMYARIHLALVAYLASLIGAHTFMVNLHAPSGMGDYPTTIVFMAMLVITGMLRAVQVMAAEAENGDGLKRSKLHQGNLIDV